MEQSPQTHAPPVHTELQPDVKAPQDVHAETKDGQNDLSFLNNQPQPQAGDDVDPPVQWVLWTYLCVGVFTLINLAISSYGINGIDSDGSDSYFYSTFGSVHFILAASVMTIFAIAYGVAYELHWGWVVRNARFRWELQMAIGTFIFELFWFAGSIAQAAWLSQGQYCGAVGCSPLTPQARSIYSVITVFAFAEWVAWTPLTVRAGVESYRQLQKSRDHGSDAVRGV